MEKLGYIWFLLSLFFVKGPLVFPLPSRGESENGLKIDFNVVALILLSEKLEDLGDWLAGLPACLRACMCALAYLPICLLFCLLACFRTNGFRRSLVYGLVVLLAGWFPYSAAWLTAWYAPVPSSRTKIDQIVRDFNAKNGYVFGDDPVNTVRQQWEDIGGSSSRTFDTISSLLGPKMKK